MWADNAQARASGEESGSEEESEEESGSEEEESAVTREDRKKDKKARKDAAVARKKAEAVEVGDMPTSESESDDDAAPVNPNHSKASRDMAKTARDAPKPSKPSRNPVAEVTEKLESVTVGTNRRERETADAAAAKERYRAMHEAGKTDEAKSDMARLALIREQRAAQQARRDVSTVPFTPPPNLTVLGSWILTACLSRPRRRIRRSRRPRGEPSAMPRWVPRRPRRAAGRSRPVVVECWGMGLGLFCTSLGDEGVCGCTGIGSVLSLPDCSASLDMYRTATRITHRTSIPKSGTHGLKRGLLPLCNYRGVVIVNSVRLYTTQLTSFYEVKHR